MSGDPSGSTTDLDAWVKEHKVGWRLALLRECVKGHGMVQTSYELTLFGRFDPASEDDGTLALEALGPLSADALIRVLPFGRTVVPADASFFVEVEFTVVGSPAHSDHPLSPADARRRIAALEDGLHSMGLHERTGNLARSDGTLVAQVACHRRGTVAETNAVAAGRTEWPNRMHLVRPTRTDEGRSRRGESRTHAADPKVSSPR